MKRARKLTKKQLNIYWKQKQQLRDETNMYLRKLVTSYFSKGFKNRRVKHLPRVVHLHATLPK